jgi:signal peptidase I
LGTTSGPDEGGAPSGGAVGTSGGKRKAPRSTLLDYALIAVVAIGLALVIQAFLVKPYRIPSPSMASTLVEGDRVLVNRVVYHLQDVKRGDVLVFRYPVNRDIVFIKRVVGLPGDRLKAEDGRLYVNGVAQDEPYVHKTAGVTDPTNPEGAIAGTTMTRPWGLLNEYTVPADSYFMMGDNRTNSDDSRVWGPVPVNDLIGEAFFIYWPPGHLGTL